MAQLRSELEIKKEEIMRYFLKENSLKNEKNFTQNHIGTGGSTLGGIVPIHGSYLNSNLPSQNITPRNRKTPTNNNNNNNINTVDNDNDTSLLTSNNHGLGTLVSSPINNMMRKRRTISDNDNYDHINIMNMNNMGGGNGNGGGGAEQQLEEEMNSYFNMEYNVIQERKKDSLFQTTRAQPRQRFIFNEAIITMANKTEDRGTQTF